VGRYVLLSTASLSAVGYEHNLSQPLIRFWNDDRHILRSSDLVGEELSAADVGR